MQIISRNEWGARPARWTNFAFLSLGMCTHWEGPTMGFYDEIQAYDKVKSIQNFHMDGRGWADIAYNFVISRWGQVFEGRGWNKNNAANGGWANTNNEYLAVCYLGGINDPFTAEAKLAYLELRTEYVTKHGGGLRAYTHGDILSWFGDGTQCSGSLVDWTHNVLDNAPIGTLPPINVPTIPGLEDDEMKLLKTAGPTYYLVRSEKKIRLLDAIAEFADPNEANLAQTLKDLENHGVKVQTVGDFALALYPWERASDNV